MKEIAVIHIGDRNADESISLWDKRSAPTCVAPAAMPSAPAP